MHSDLDLIVYRRREADIIELAGQRRKLGEDPRLVPRVSLFRRTWERIASRARQAQTATTSAPAAPADGTRPSSREPRLTPCLEGCA